MLSIEQVKQLKHGDIIYQILVSTSNHSPSNTTMVKASKPIAWRVNGKIKLWKRQPDKFSLPVKHGLYQYGYITEDNCHVMSLTKD